MIRTLSRLGFLISFIIFPLLVMELASQRLANIPLRLAVFIILALGGAWLFKKGWPRQGWGTALLVTTLGYGVSYKIAGFIPDISSYPFSLGWSEASRYYYASLWFSNKVYGTSTPPSVLHPSRYLLQSLPFIIPHCFLVISSVVAGDLVGRQCFSGQLVACQEIRPEEPKPASGHNPLPALLGVPLSLSRSHLLSPACHGHSSALGL